eukprot:2608347-Prymnesium_polylepis.1
MSICGIIAILSPVAQTQYAKLAAENAALRAELTSFRAQLPSAPKAATTAPLNVTNPFSVHCITSEQCTSRADCPCHVTQADMPKVCPKSRAVTRRCIYRNVWLLAGK